MSWETFKPKHGRAFTNIEKIRISSYGQICFSKPCSKYFQEKERVLVLIDKETNRVGLKPISEKDERRGYSRKACRHSANGNYMLSAQSLLKSIGVFNKKPRDFINPWDEEEQMFIINLKEYE